VPMFTRIEGDRIVLRRLAPADAEVVFAYRADPAVWRHQNWVPASVEEVREFIAGLSGLEPDSPGRWFQMGIGLRESGELIGDCGVHVSAADPRQAEIGISLAPRFQRRGLGAEALRALLGYLFDELAKHRVFGSVDPRNAASLALLRRCGMRQEAHFVESCWSKGEWTDDVVFGLLRREWVEARRG
jgi:RimJ/RimL family protein N-acetyltransferase